MKAKIYTEEVGELTVWDEHPAPSSANNSKGLREDVPRYASYTVGTTDSRGSASSSLASA